MFWNPYHAFHSQKIENIQIAFTKHLAYTKNPISPHSSYDSRLKCYNMNSLRERRRTSDLAFLHKMANNRLDCKELVSRISIAVPYKIPRHPIIKQYYVQPYKTSMIFIKELPDFDIHHDSMNSLRSEIRWSLKSVTKESINFFMEFPSNEETLYFDCPRLNTINIYCFLMFLIFITSFVFIVSFFVFASYLEWYVTE